MEILRSIPSSCHVSVSRRGGLPEIFDREAKRRRKAAPSQDTQPDCSSSSSDETASSSGSESDALSGSEIEDDAMGDLLEFAYGPSTTDKVHILTAEGGLPGCAHREWTPVDSYKIGLSNLPAGRKVCKRCAKRAGLDVR